MAEILNENVETDKSYEEDKAANKKKKLERASISGS